MSDLPLGWEWTTLGEIADTSLGKMLDRGKPAGHNEVPYLRNFNVQWGRFDLSDVFTMEIPPDEREYYRINHGDLLVCEGGEIGRCAVWVKQSGYIAFQKALHRVRPFDQVDVRYLRYLLEYLSATDALSALSTGSTIKHLPQVQLRRIRVPLPPAAEQRRIVDTIEDHLSRLGAGCGYVSSAKVKANLFRTAYLDGIVLGARRRNSESDDQSFSELEEKGATKIDYTKLPSLPLGWKWRVASDACASVACGGTPKSDLMYADHGDVPFLKVYNLTKRGVIDFSVRPTFIDRSTHSRQLRRSQVRPGDVLTNIVGPPLGKTAVVPKEWPEWNINQAIVAFRAGPDITPDWLALVLQSPFILGLLERTARATAGQFNVSLSTCRELPLPVPPKPQQRELVSRAGMLLDQAERSSNTLRLIAQRGQHLRQALLAEAFAGRLVEQVPDDEPASVLLERIRAERAARPTVKRGRRSGKSESGQGSLL